MDVLKTCIVCPPTIYGELDLMFAPEVLLIRFKGKGEAPAPPEADKSTRWLS